MDDEKLAVLQKLTFDSTRKRFVSSIGKRRDYVRTCLGFTVCGFCSIHPDTESLAVRLRRGVALPLQAFTPSLATARNTVRYDWSSRVNRLLFRSYSGGEVFEVMVCNGEGRLDGRMCLIC